MMMFVTILTVCALISCLPVDAGNVCQDGWVPFKGKCYFISTTKANWHASVSSCYGKGSRLASVKSKEEFQFLISYARIKNDGIWLDGNDIKEEGKWIWSYNGEPINLAFWQNGEPNGKRSENCLMISKYSNKWKWNDAACKSSFYFACQKEMRTSLDKQCLSAKDLLHELIKCKLRCKSVWLGGQLEDGNWIWENKEKFSLNLWGPHEPNGGSIGESCMSMKYYREQDKWMMNDERCELGLYFICQKEVQNNLEKQSPSDKNEYLSKKDLMSTLMKCKFRCKQPLNILFTQKPLGVQGLFDQLIECILSCKKP